MVHAVHYITLSHTFYSLPDQCLVAIMGQASELSCSQRAELLLDFAEDELDRVVLRRVRDVEDAAEAELCRF